MRLALLTHEPFHPPSGGGSAEAVYLVEALRRRGHEVHVFGPAVADPAGVEARFGVRLHPFARWRMGRYTRLRSPKYVLYPFFLERMVRSAARARPFDLLLSQHAISAVAAGRAKRRLGVPVVMNFLDYLTGFMETWPVWLMPPPVLALLKRYELSLPQRFDVDAVLTVSDTLADHFAGAGYPRERLQPIYYGYDASLFPCREEAVRARAAAPPIVAMHGSFDHHHLGPVARAAVKLVAARRPDARFRFVGVETSALRHFLDDVRPHLPAGAIQCTGFVPYERVASHLAEATVGMVPYELSTGTHCAFVAKIVEYLGVGLPVVSTPLEGIRRYFASEPLVRFPPADGAAFGQAILDWLAVPALERARLAPDASRRVREALDWRVICDGAVQAIERVQARAAGPAVP